MKKLLVLLLLTSSAHALGDWSLDPAGSFVGFASVKNDLVAENHHFTKISGSVSDEGQAKVVIELASVETHIPIRNERMQQVLFDTKSFPLAEITARPELESMTALKTGESKMTAIDLNISLHGQMLTKNVPVRITRSHSSVFEVSSLGPIMVHASQFGLADGVEALRSIAGLQSITLTVPVTFSLQFVQSAGE